MCGIVGYVGSKDCADVLIDSLSKLEYRGYDSAGIGVFEKGEISVCKAKGELKNLTEKMKKDVVAKDTKLKKVGYKNY